VNTNPVIYFCATLTLLFISLLIFPGSTTSSKRDNVASSANTGLTNSSKGIRRTRSLARSSSEKGVPVNDDSSLAASDQISELVMPGRKPEKATSSGESSSFGSTQATLFPTQESSTAEPQVIPFVGPVSLDRDLRTLPEIPQLEDEEEERLSRYPTVEGSAGINDPFQPIRLPALPSAMPTPLQTFPGITSAQSACGCLPPDTDGDIGTNHYIQAVNSRFKINDKAGTELVAPTTYNSLFAALGPTTPCGNNQNRGDAVVFYDHMADRWVISDFAFPAFPGVLFYQCFAVSKTADPVAGGWWLYALQVDPANPTFLGDYPKFGVWPDAYYMSVNMFSNNTTFNGVRVYALPRNAMINGTGAPTAPAIAFSITPANLGDTYSLLPATFRSGIRPAAGGVVTPEYFMSIDSSATAGNIENEVYTWRFHADFATPANSTFGVGVNHTPNATITVNNFVDAFTSAGTAIVPQTGTTALLDTLGDKLMYPLVYQNLGGVESIYASHTINNNQGGTGPTAIRWYQFNVTGSTIPATPTQQQTFNNGADGLWRFMPSINVDGQGNMAIGYSVSSSGTNPAISYAGRLTTDAPNTLGQGEALLIQGAGHQTSASGRWGDYSSTFIDPADNCTFWHTNEYYSATSSAAWNTRIGTFRFPGCIQTPTAAPATISGRITTPAGTPLAGVTVNLSGGRSARVITDSNGNYRFNNIDTGNFYVVTPSLTNYHFSPESLAFSLLANKTDAVFTATPNAVITGNVIDTPEFFVRQHYLDFLNREPDESGFNFWSDQILECGSDASCLEIKRINVSAAYFLSIEFRETGGLVDGLYRASYGRRPAYAEFMPDTAVVARDVIVGRADWAQQLAANKETFVDAWVQRAEFQSCYSALSNAAYVDGLIANTGVSFTTGERDALVSGLGDGSLTRAGVLRQIAEDGRFVSAKFNETFVMMEYFGYLRRDPDESGFRFWLQKLNQFNGNFVQAEMVKAFINSGEYLQRFGQ
jgi:hypothetical protein